MFKEFIEQSPILSLTSEESSEETHKVVLKVEGSDKQWMKIVYLMLKTAEEQESFGVSVSKEFFLSEGSPTFIWVCIFWGDKDEALKHCGPILGRRFGPPAPPKSVAVGAAAVNPSIRKKVAKVEHQSGGITAVTVPLPHRRGNRDKDPDTVVGINDRSSGIRASVRGVK